MSDDAYDHPDTWWDVLHWLVPRVAAATILLALAFALL